MLNTNTTTRHATMTPPAYASPVVATPTVPPGSLTPEQIAAARAHFDYLCRTMFRTSPVGHTHELIDAPSSAVSVQRTEHGSHLSARIHAESWARLFAIGAHIADGDALVLRAHKNRKQSARLGADVYSATWVRQGRGLSLITETGWIFARRDGSGWGRSMHADLPRIRSHAVRAEHSLAVIGAAVGAPVTAPVYNTDNDADASPSDALHAAIYAQLQAAEVKLQEAQREREKLLQVLAVLDGEESATRPSVTPPEVRNSGMIRRAG